jgi:protein phosphatase PTC1
LKDKQVLYQGSTVVSCYIKKETTEKQTVKKLYTANVGDARAVLCHEGKAHRLSYDHKANDASESKRITDAKGFISYNRVNGILAVTRALGDHAMKEWVVCDPYYTELTLTSKDQFLILACDGVWDVMTDQDAVDLIQGEDTAQKMADLLIKTTLNKGSTDNISVMIIQF